MNVIIRSNNNPVSGMSVVMSGFITDFYKVITIESLSCHQQGEKLLEGCLCSQEGNVGIKRLQYCGCLTCVFVH